MEFGYLVVFRPNGKSSAPYELEKGEHTIGSSMDSNIHLKFYNPLLLDTHAIIRVNENGVATLVNKSVGAPVKVNGKMALKPIILRHEDKFEILEKVFQYFNENLKNEPENSEKFVKEKKNILAKNRQSVNPLIKTPAKKSPILKTKVPSIRKSTSAVKSVSRPTPAKGVKVIITPNKKPVARIGSKTTSKIIVSKALVSPRSARKRRLSLDNPNKASQGPKVSSRNILLSKSTINITISEEHEYSEVIPSKRMKTIHENDKPQEEVMQTKGKTPRRSVKIEESGNTPNKDISVALIDFDTPDTPSLKSRRLSNKNTPLQGGASVKMVENGDTANEEFEALIDFSSPAASAATTPIKSRHSASKNTPLQRETNVKTEDFTEELLPIQSSSNIMKTPVNKRIQSLKTLRHSLKKDTPPPRITVPKITVQEPTPQSRRPTRVSSNEKSNISITISPSAEPSTHNLTSKENKTPRSIVKKNEESSTPSNKSRVSFAIEAPNEASPTHFENINTDEESTGKRSITNEKLSLPDVSELSKSRTSFRYSLNSTKKLDDSSQQDVATLNSGHPLKSRTSQGGRKSAAEEILATESSEENTDVDEQNVDQSKRKSLRKIAVSASTEYSDAERGRSGRKSGRRSSKLEKSNVEESLENSSRNVASASRRSQMEDPVTGNLLHDNSSAEEREDSSSKKSPNHSSRNTSRTGIKVHGDGLLSEDDELAKSLEKSLDVSRSSRNSKSQTEESPVSEDGLQEIADPLDKMVNKSARQGANLNKSRNKSLNKTSTKSRNTSRPSTRGQNEDVSSDEMDELQIDATSISFSSQDVSKSQEKSLRLSKNTSRNSNESTNSFYEENATSAAKSSPEKLGSRLSRNVSIGSSKLDQSSNSLLLEDNDTRTKESARKSFRLSRNFSKKSLKLEEPASTSFTQDEVTDFEDNGNKSARLLGSIKYEPSTSYSQTEDNSTDAEEIDCKVSRKSSRLSRNVSRRSAQYEKIGDSSQNLDDTTDAEENDNKVSRLSRNSSRRSRKHEASASSSQVEDNTTDGEENVNKSSRLSRNLSRRSAQFEKMGDSSQNLDDTTDAEENDNKVSRLSRNSSRRSRKHEASADSSQVEDNTTDGEENVNKSSRLSRNVSRSAQFEKMGDSSQNLDDTTDAEENDSKVSRLSRNSSRRSRKHESSASSSQIEGNITDGGENVDRFSKLSRNLSRRSAQFEKMGDYSQNFDDTTDAEENDNKVSRLSRNSSRRSRKHEASADSSQVEDNITDGGENVDKFSKLSRNLSRRSAQFEKMGDYSQNFDDTTDAEENDNKVSRLSRNSSRRSRKHEASADSSQVEDNTTDGEENVNKSSRLSRNVSRSAQFEKMGDSSQNLDDTTDAEENDSRVSRLSRNSSRRSPKHEASASYSQIDYKTTDGEKNINKSSRLSRNASRSAQYEKIDDSSQNLDDTTGAEENDNEVSRLSRNSSRRNTKHEASASYSQIEDNGEENIIKSSRLSRNVSRRSTQFEKIGDSLQNFDGTTDGEENANKSSRLSRNVSRSAQLEEIGDLSQNVDDVTDANDNVNKYSRLSRNASRKITDLDRSVGYSVIEGNSTDTDESVSKSASLPKKSARRSTNMPGILQEAHIQTPEKSSRNSSRRSMKYESSARLSENEENTTDGEKNVNKSSRSPRNVSGRSTQFEEVGESSQIDNTADAEENVNKSSRLSRNASRKTTNLDRSASSSMTEDNSTDADESVTKSSRLLKNISRKSTNLSGVVPEVLIETPEKSSRNSSRRSQRIVISQSSIDSAETTMDNRQKEEKGEDTLRNVENKLRQRFSIYDESTQEAKLNPTVSKNKSQQRASIFDESTREILPEFDKSKSAKTISILDDTREVLSPVGPLSPRKSIRNIQNRDIEGTISPSTRVSSIRRSRTKSRTLQDSSLTSTSLDQSSSSVISVSSQSFSSFKKGSSIRENSRDETEIDVVNISSTTETPEVKRISMASSGNIKKEILEENNISRSSIRQSRTSEMFKDVSCTSTPFHKQNVSKKSQESEAAVIKNSVLERTSFSGASSSKRLEIISISSDSVITDSPIKRGPSASNVFDETELPRRRSSSRSSIFKNGGHHNCISCNNSSVKRSRSLSSVSESSVVEKRNSTLTSSKTARKSSGSILEQSYEATSPVKRTSNASTSKMTTPLLHRKSLVASLSENTPETFIETEDETPKSSIKPARRSSKANQSAYNPLLEDITPVTPEKLMVSGFTEEVFKTPVNTPGLFESIRKSVIRSRKRHRESTGSNMKDSKRPRVDFADEEQLGETFNEESPQPRQHKPQMSPANRLSDFEGVKKLMKTPPKLPKNDLRNIPNLRKFFSPKEQASPKNDLTNVAGVKKMFSTPKEARSPKNDLTNIPNLRRLVSPRRQNTPKNDLTQVPNLRRIMSPKDQHSPKNDLSDPVGVKELLKTPRVQKEPENDLGNVTGVASMFNVSGVEVLHQGSDIENSEDLFTKLTGKRPARAYHRGKSLSPNKEEQQKKARSRKTMGDIPVCSPRVQQWVQDHANVMYKSVENVNNDDEDVFFNISEKPQSKSRGGRSVSPQKPVQDAKNRRKTQEDGLADEPDVSAWKEEQARQARSRRSSTAKNTTVKTELTSPQPIETLQVASVKTEKVTPQQQKFKTEHLTSHSVNATPSSVKTRRGGARLAQEDQLSLKVVDKEVVGSADTKAKRGPKITIQIEAQQSTDTPKEIINKPLEAVKPTRRGKRIMSAEELDVISSTTLSPVPKPAAKRTRTRRGGAQVEQVETVEIPMRARRGKLDSESSAVSDDAQTKLSAKPRSRRGQKQSESESIESVEPKQPTKGRMKKNHVEDVQVTSEVSASPVRKGGRRGKKVEKDVAVENEQVCEKEAKRSVKGKAKNETQKTEPQDEILDKPDAEIEMQQKPATSRSRRGKKIADEQDDVDVQNEITIKPAAKGRRGKKLAEEQDIVQMDIVGQSKKDSKKPVSGRRGRKIEKSEETDSEDVLEQIVDVEVEKTAPKGRRGKKEVPQDTEIDDKDVVDENKEPEDKKPSRGRKGKTLEAEKATESKNEDLAIPVEELYTKKAPRSRRGKKVQEQRETERQDEEQVEQESKITKAPAKGRRGKKIEESRATEENELQEDTEVEFKRPTRGRAKKDELQATSTPTEIVASPMRKTSRRAALQNKEEPDVTPSPAGVKITRNKKGPKLIEDETAQAETVEEKVPAKRGRGRKLDVELESEPNETEEDSKFVPLKKVTRGKGKKVEELKKPAEKVDKTPEVVGSPSKPTRGRSKKVVEETLGDQEKSSRKDNAKKPRNKVIEEVIEMDIDSPRTARAKRGINKKYSAEEFEVVEKKVGTKRKVHFEDDASAEKETPEVETRKSKRTRK